MISHERKEDKWDSGASYESYIGRWSRLVASKFLTWLDVPSSAHWLDVGCGIGTLSQTILDTASPQAVLGIDSSEGYIEFACTWEMHKHSQLSQPPMMPLSLDSFSILFLNQVKP